MPETTIPTEREPVPELTPHEHNHTQVKLLERFVSGGGQEVDWTKNYAERFRKLVEADESIRLLIRRDLGMALDVIEEVLKDEAGGN